MGRVVCFIGIPMVIDKYNPTILFYCLHSYLSAVNGDIYRGTVVDDNECPKTAFFPPVKT